jgi:hypothetical protein
MSQLVLTAGGGDLDDTVSLDPPFLDVADHYKPFAKLGPRLVLSHL